MSKNYLDIAANGNLVKKSIEELCYAISQNPEENSGKYFKLRYDTDNEHTNELDRVSIVLETIDSNLPKINGELGQILINDGNNWISPSEIFFSSNEFETRIGPNLIDTSKKSFILNGNPLFKTKEDGSLRDNETFKFSLNDFANVSFGGENLSVLDGASQLILHDNSKLNLTRNAQLYAHGPVQINIDDGSYLDNNNIRKYNYSGDNSVEYLNAATLRLHDKSLLSMSQGASIIAQGMPRVFFEGEAKTYIRDNSNINMSNGATLTLQNDSNYDPCLWMNGGLLLFNARDDYSKIPYDPCLIAETNQFTYIGQSAQGIIRNNDYNHPIAPSFNIPKMILFEENFTFTDKNATEPVNYFNNFTESNKNALISALRKAGYGSWDTIVNGNSEVTSVALEEGYSYTVSNFYYSKGNTRVFGDIADLVPQNNIPRFKIANETMIVIDAQTDRGANYIRIGAEDKTLQLLLLGNIFQQMTGNAHSEIHDNSKFIMRGPSEVPWVGEDNGHCGENWITPIKPTNSPVLGLYDVSQFIMRGKWEYNEEDKPIDWNPTIEKIEGQPLLEIIENAEVRITGNSVLKMNDFSIEATSEGISFGSGEDSVIFSIEELKKLKTFLNNSEIGE